MQRDVPYLTHLDAETDFVGLAYISDIEECRSTNLRVTTRRPRRYLFLFVPVTRYQVGEGTIPRGLREETPRTRGDGMACALTYTDEG